MKFDVIVITAANDGQADGYRIAVERLQGVLAPEILVVPDPGNRRVGSLGSTVNLLRRFGRKLRGKRVLVCHSGGDSKRLPAYAALGKAFVPVPQSDGSTRSLFEVIVGNMERLELPRTGMLVVCGDLAPSFDFAACDFSAPGVTGVGYWDSPAEGARHGVYVAASGRARAAVPVRGFLQKPDLAAAKRAGAVRRGREIVDTGILWLDEATTLRLARSGWTEGDLYEKFAAELVAGFAPFSVNVLGRCDFFHIGSSRELLDRLGGGREWIDGCEMPRAEMELGGENIVTGVPRSFGPVRLAKGECLMSLPVGKTAWRHIRYRIDDTFKTDGKWERLKMADLMLKVNRRRILAGFGPRPCSSVKVELPLRIDFAGGWSDTPPICVEQGGSVLNAAVTLNGVRPVQVTVSRLAEMIVDVESRDLGKRGVYRTDAEIADHADPSDWGCLVKSALTVVGYRIAEGGLRICISADVPKGSGMGTSSILGAALITALGKVRGCAYDWRKVSDLTLALEREMRTGGGWQDQLGGLLPGVKLLRSTPGARQRIAVKTLGDAATRRFSKFLRDRALLYFTGQKRMARNVLCGVLRFYRDNPSGIARAVVGRLKREAVQGFQAIERGDWCSFCAAVNGYWLSKKALDPGSTNPGVEAIIARIAPWTAAVSLCGAGGGGFMFIVASSRAAKARLKTVLESYPTVESGKFYDLELA